MKKKLLLALSLFLAVAIVPSALHAQFSIGSDGQITMTAIPPRLGDDFQLKAKPGEKIQTTVRIRNSSSQPITIKSTMEDFILDEDGETPVPVTSEVSNRWSLTSWSVVSPETQMVQPLQTATVNLIIDVPADALPGGHYGMILHEPVSDTSGEGGAQSSISQRVGTLVYFLVEGPINEEALIRDFTFPQLTEKGPTPFSFMVENLSDIHIVPQIKVDIYNIFNKKVDTILVDSKNVFPFVAREFKSEWNRVWGIGPYTAEVTMSYGSNGQIAIARTQFWLFPLKLVIAGVAGILFLLVIIMLIGQMLKQRQQYNRRKIENLESELNELKKDRP